MVEVVPDLDPTSVERKDGVTMESGARLNQAHENLARAVQANDLADRDGRPRPYGEPAMVILDGLAAAAELAGKRAR
jgi:hypothetical protein